MDTDSQPRGDRTEVDRLLHQLRSTLARLKAELEVLQGAGPAGIANPLDSAVEAIGLLTALEAAARRQENPIVFLVDDDHRLGAAIGELLTRSGFAMHVHTRLSDIPAHVPVGARLIVDLSVLRLARPADRSRIKCLKPIVLTGSTDPLAATEAVSYGAAECLVKPVDVALLIAMLLGRDHA